MNTTESNLFQWSQGIYGLKRGILKSQSLGFVDSEVPEQKAVPGFHN